MDLYSTPDNPLNLSGDTHAAAVSFEVSPVVEYAPYLLVRQAPPGVPGLEPRKAILGFVCRPGTTIEEANRLAEEMNGLIESFACMRIAV